MSAVTGEILVVGPLAWQAAAAGAVHTAGNVQIDVVGVHAGVDNGDVGVHARVVDPVDVGRRALVGIDAIHTEREELRERVQLPGVLDLARRRDGRQVALLEDVRRR